MASVTLLVSRSTPVTALLVTFNPEKDTTLVAATQDRPINQRTCAAMVGRDFLKRSLALQHPDDQAQAVVRDYIPLEILLEIPGYLECFNTASLA